MAWLLASGLMIFIALHSLRSHLPDVRAALILRLGIVPFRLVYSLLTILALALVGWGLVAARQSPVVIFQPDPSWRPFMSFGMWWVALGIAASWVPGTHIKAKLKQPLLLAIVLWAVLHVSVSAYLHQWVICLAILGWAVSVLWRDWSLQVPPPISIFRDVMAVTLASVMWFVFGQYLHAWIIGIPVSLYIFG